MFSFLGWDYGMIPLEVKAYVIPVITYRKWGALDTAFENEIIDMSSNFFDAQASESLQKCLNK